MPFPARWRVFSASRPGGSAPSPLATGEQQIGVGVRSAGDLPVAQLIEGRALDVVMLRPVASLSGTGQRGEMFAFLFVVGDPSCD